MNKAIIPAVIIVGVVAIILSSFQSDMDMKIEGAEPLVPLHIEGRTTDNGEIICPDGKTKESSKIRSSVTFSKDVLGHKGTFHITAQDTNPQREVTGILYNGNLTSSDYQVYGVAQINEALANHCGVAYPDLNEIMVWGLCGEGVTINFETSNGFKGSSVGTVVCV